MLVPAATDAGPRVFLVDPRAPGVRIEKRLGSGRRPIFDLVLAGAHAGEILGGEDFDASELLRWLDDVALVALAATQIGVSERALEITADYVKQRVQFGVPIGSFTAVQHRCADAWIDLEALRWTTWRAAWKLAQGEDAHREALVAKFWAADAGARIATATQHLHGGMGVDLDYPIHRYFLWSKALELEHGGGTPAARAPRPRAGPQRAAGAAMTARSPSLAKIQVGDALPELRGAAHQQPDRGRRRRLARLHPRAPRQGRRAGRRHAGRVHEHPDHRRLGRRASSPTGPGPTRRSGSSRSSSARRTCRATRW